MKHPIKKTFTIETASGERHTFSHRPNRWRFIVRVLKAFFGLASLLAVLSMGAAAIALPAPTGEPVDVIAIQGTRISTGAGPSGAGTLRIILASDSPAPAAPANQSVSFTSGSFSNPLYFLTTDFLRVYVVSAPTSSVTGSNVTIFGSTSAVTVLGNVAVTGTFFQAVQTVAMSSGSIATPFYITSNGAIFTVSTATRIDASLGAIPVRDTGTINVAMSSGSASTPFYIVVNGALPVKSTSTILDMSAGSPTFTSTSTRIDASLGAVPVRDTGTLNISFSSGTASTPLYIVVNGALFVKSTSTVIDWSGGAGNFTSTNVILGAGAASIGDVFNTPRISSVQVYNVPGSSMAVTVSSANITQIGNMTLPPGRAGFLELPIRSEDETRLMNQLLMQALQINEKMSYILDALGRSYSPTQDVKTGGDTP